MLQRLAAQLTSFICIEAYNNPKDRAKIQYGLSVILSEGFKILFLILFFTIIHNQIYFYFSLCILLSIRIFSGGVHVNGTLICLFLTTLIFTLTCVLAPLMPRLNTEYYLLGSILSLIIVLIRAPICSVVRPIKSSKKKLQYKFTAALSIAIWTIILLSLAGTPYINCGFGTIFAQNIQLVLVKNPKL